jgi:hypothetical protein
MNALLAWWCSWFRSTNGRASHMPVGYQNVPSKLNLVPFGTPIWYLLVPFGTFWYPCPGNSLPDFVYHSGCVFIITIEFKSCGHVFARSPRHLPFRPKQRQVIMGSVGSGREKCLPRPVMLRQQSAIQTVVTTNNVSQWPPCYVYQTNILCVCTIPLLQQLKSPPIGQ